MKSSSASLATVLQAILLAHGKALSIPALQELLAEEGVQAKNIRAALQQLDSNLVGSALELKEVATGWRLQIRQEFSSYIHRLSEERPQRYSRALLETLALIAYKQPVTRGEIEDVRGVAVGSQIIKTLQEREWIKIVGYKDVPGKPALLATTKNFLDYFNLTSLSELPPLNEVRDLGAAFERLQDNLAEMQHSLSQDESDTEPTETPNLHELSFSSLLAELEAMESNLKTDFDDIRSNAETNCAESYIGKS